MYVTYIKFFFEGKTCGRNGSGWGACWGMLLACWDMLAGVCLLSLVREGDKTKIPKTIQNKKRQKIFLFC
jgi:hypothetical protein